MTHYFKMFVGCYLSKKNNDERLTHVFSHNDNSGVYSVLQGKISTSQLVFDELMNLIK